MLNIQFNFDFEGAVNLSESDRQAYENALRVAADAWSVFIHDDFEPLRPGTTFEIVNPSDRTQRKPITLEDNIDDILIFVGWADLGDATNDGNSQVITGGVANSGSTQFFGDSLAARISSDFRGQGPVTDYEPWTGSITFNSRLLPPEPGEEPDNLLGTIFSFEEGGEDGNVHFISTAVHEIGHVLGIGSSPAFQNLVTGTDFNGVNSSVLNQDENLNEVPIPLEVDGVHILNGFYSNSVAMDPVDLIGTIKYPSQFDLAMLADIGYHISGSIDANDREPVERFDRLDDNFRFDRQGERPDIATDGGETISGTTARDIIFGEGGDDTVFGNDGDDVLAGGEGNDWLVGGIGADVFEFGFGSGADGIQDFNLGEDLLRISSRYALTPQEIAEAAVEFNTSGEIGVYRIDFGGGNVLTVQYEKSSGVGLDASHIVVANTDRGDFASPVWQSDLDAMGADHSVFWRTYPGHGGLDYLLPEGTPVRAIADGIVYRAATHWPGDNPSRVGEGFGELVIVEHAGEVFSIYGHLSAYGPGLEGFQTVAPAAMPVRAGDIIGYSGDTGLSSGPHLHLGLFELSGTGLSFSQTRGSTGVPDLANASWLWPNDGGDPAGRLNQYLSVLFDAPLIAAEADQSPAPSESGGTDTHAQNLQTSAKHFFDGIVDARDRDGNGTNDRDDLDTFAFYPEEGREYRIVASGAPIRDYQALPDPHMEVWLTGGREIPESQLAPLQFGRTDVLEFLAQSGEAHYIYVEAGLSFAGDTGGYTLIVEDITDTNVLLPGLGPEDFTIAGTTPTTVFASPEELNGDRFFNFWNRDSFIVQETIEPGEYRVREGSALIDLDLDGDGNFETMWTLEGDYTSGQFFLIQGIATTTIAFAEITLGIESGERLEGNDGRDRIWGVSGNDTLYGLGGDDTLNGGENDDRVIGGDGNDVLNGEAGNDVLIDRGGTANTLNGGAGEDRVVTGSGSDTVSGGSERDVIKTFAGADSINGDDGDDVILSGTENDTVFGGDGDDVIKTSLGDDYVDGGDGNDIIFTWRGDDTAIGGAGDDTIRGDFDDDIIEGGSGNDRLIGAPGRDTFIFRDGFEEDRILDFTNGSDLMDFTNHTGVSAIGDLSISQVSTNVVITDGSGGRIVLADTDILDIDSGDFVFVV